MTRFLRAVVHAGFDKTGSSAIQQAFDLGREELARLGLLYPAGRWHAQLGSCFSTRPEEFVLNQYLGRRDPEHIRLEDARYLAALEAELEASDASQLVLSYEGFAALDAEGLARLDAFLRRFAQATLVVAYCRPPLAYAISAMSQRVRMGVAPWAEPPVIPYRDYLGRLRAAFGDAGLLVLPQPAGDVVADFCARIGLSPGLGAAAAGDSGRANRALSREAFLIGERIAALAGDRVGSRQEFTARFSAVLGAIAGERALLSPAESARVLAAAAADLAFLREAHGVSFEDESPLVSEAPCRLGAATADSIAAELVRLLVPESPDRPQRREASADEFELSSAALRSGPSVAQGQVMTFELEFLLWREVAELEAGIHIFDADGRGAFGVNTTMLEQRWRDLRPGAYRASYHVMADLPIGTYSAGFGFAERRGDESRVLAWLDGLCQFEVARSGERPFAGYAALASLIEVQVTALARKEDAVTSAAGSLRLAQAAPGRLVAGRPATLTVELANLSGRPWTSEGLRPVCLAYHWRDPAGRSVVFDGVRTALPGGQLGAGQTARAEMTVAAPAEPGRYTLVLTVVQEKVAWFEEIGFAPAVLEVEVSAAPAAFR